jgi:hypothetical protein
VKSLFTSQESNTLLPLAVRSFTSNQEMQFRIDGCAVDALTSARVESGNAMLEAVRP